LFNNRENFYALIEEFKADVEEEETEQLLTALEIKLQNINYDKK